MVTATTSMQLPDLSALGFAWPKGSTIVVVLRAYAPRTVDDVAAGQERPPDGIDGMYVDAAHVSFTMTPGAY